MANVAQGAWRHFFGQLTSSRIGLGLLVSAPAIFSWLAGMVMEVSVDRRLRPVQAQIQSIDAESGQLQDFVRRFEAIELARGSLLISLSAVNAPENYRYVADRFYRANSEAIGSLRRATAVLYPDQWKQILEPYEKLLADGYETREQVDTMQAVDNKVMLASRNFLTAAETRKDALQAQAASLLNTRYWMSLMLQPLGLICSLIAFVYNLKPRTDPGPPA